MNYQEKVSTRADVRALYERVIANPAIACYRGYTETKSYGWDVAVDDVIKREGEHWFENPSYDADYVPEGTPTHESAELLDEQLEERDRRIRDLDAERGELCALIDALNEQIAEREHKAEALEHERDDARAALSSLREAFGVIRRWLSAE
ncbi:MAG: hypothetical protein IJA78_06800 [Clostridia bacterium]|nr:hypothetical protein [Clostridia bacterium]